MTNFKKYLSLSSLTIACLGTIGTANATENTKPKQQGHNSNTIQRISDSNNSRNYEELVMYRGLVMTPKELQEQKRFEQNLVNSNQNETLMIGYSEDIEGYSNMGSPDPNTTQLYSSVRVIPTSEKVQRSLPLTREEVINEYVRARDSGELKEYEELYRN